MSCLAPVTAIPNGGHVGEGREERRTGKVQGSLVTCHATRFLRFPYSLKCADEAGIQIYNTRLADTLNRKKLCN